jgi:hypothetical protein
MPLVYIDHSPHLKIQNLALAAMPTINLLLLVPV